MKYCWSAALLMTTNRPPASPEPAASDPAGALALLEAAVDGAALLAGEHAAATIATPAIRMEIRCDLMGWNPPHSAPTGGGSAGLAARCPIGDRAGGPPDLIANGPEGAIVSPKDAHRSCQSQYQSCHYRRFLLAAGSACSGRPYLLWYSRQNPTGSAALSVSAPGMSRLIECCRPALLGYVDFLSVARQSLWVDIRAKRGPARCVGMAR